MRSNKLHTPEGVKDSLPQEFAFASELKERLERVFHQYGYLSLQSPMFEFVEVFEGKGSVDLAQMFKFVDRDGHVLALRSDMTPPIARIAATAFSHKDFPLRLCYVENVFRCNEQYQGKQKEFTQAGVELIGSSALDASAEVIAVAINGLLATGLKNFQIDLGQVDFFQGILEEGNFCPNLCKTLYQLVIERDYVAVEQLVSQSQAPKETKMLFAELPLLIGDMSVLNLAKTLTKSQKALSAIKNLEDIYDILIGYGVQEHISFDLGMVAHVNYYTGLMFRGYAEGTGLAILDGGRYDHLLEHFGMVEPAVGFAIKMAPLTHALLQQGVSFPLQKADTLLAYTKTGRRTALAIGDELRSQGLFIQNSLLGESFDENISYAKTHNLGGVLYFTDSETVVLANLGSGETKELSISDMLQAFKI